MAVKARGQIGLTDITDAYSANLSIQAFTFVGDASNPVKVASAQSFSVVVSGLCGATAVNAAVDTSALTLPTGLSVTSDGNATSPTLTFSATTSLTASTLAAVGNAVVIPVKLDNNKVTLNRAIAIQITPKGAGGTNGSDGYNQATVFLYQRAASAPSKPANSTYTFSTGALSSTPSGWSRTIPAPGTEGYPCYVTSGTAVGKGATATITWSNVTELVANGEDGAPGDDAITVVIVPSNGQVFKNSNGTNTLTAHVYVGGAEVTGTALTSLGTIKWYKGDVAYKGSGSSQITGTTCTVSASDVTNSETFEARLEG